MQHWHRIIKPSEEENRDVNDVLVHYKCSYSHINGTTRRLENLHSIQNKLIPGTPDHNPYLQNFLSGILYPLMFYDCKKHHNLSMSMLTQAFTPTNTTAVFAPSHLQHSSRAPQPSASHSEQQSSMSSIKQEGLAVLAEPVSGHL